MRKLLFSILSLVIIAVITPSCTGDQYEATRPKKEYPNKPNEDDAKYKAIIELIKNNVSIDAYYSSYIFKFDIESTLHEYMSGSKIQFGIGHGEINEKTLVTIESNAYSYSSQLENGIKKMKFENPFWYYYLYGEGSKLNNASQLYEECKLLYDNTLNFSSVDDYENSINQLKVYEKNVIYNYPVSVWVKIDGNLYGIKIYRMNSSRSIL